MQWYEEEVQHLERANAELDPAGRFAVFYGSSTIRLWSTLEQDMESPCALNRGFGGSTIEACSYFFERLIPTAHPASLVLYAGDNDLGDGRSPDQVLACFRQLAGKVKKCLGEISFGFISIKISPARFCLADGIRTANEKIRLEIANIPGAYFIPVTDAMLDPSGRPCPELFCEDGLHLSPQGYRLWTRLLLPYHNQIFNFPSQGCNPQSLSSGLHESRIP